MSELSEFIDTISVVLPNIHKKIYALKAKNLKKHKLTPPLFDLMEHIDLNTACKMSDIADEFGVSMPAVTGLVDRLIILRYVARQSDPSDRRVTRIALTAKGSDVVAEGRKGRKAGMTGIFGILSKEERKNYLSILKKVAKEFGALCFAILFSSAVYAQEGALIELNEDDVVALALENSPAIQTARYEYYISNTTVDKAHSVFDYYLDGAIDYTQDKKVSAISGGSIYANQRSYAVGVDKKFSTGTKIGTDLVYYDVDSSLYSKYKNADLSINVKQELGKNFFGLADRADISIKKLAAEYSEHLSLDSIERSIATAKIAYWYLILQDELVRVSNMAYDYSTKLYNIYSKKLDIGSAEDVDYLAVKANMISREKNLLAAVLEREKAKNDLLSILNVDDMSKNISLSDNSLVIEASSRDVISAMRSAINNRRDYKRMINLARSNQITIKTKKNALWPQLDLVATYSANGIRGTGSDAFSDISGNADDSFFLGMTFSLSLNNTSEKADLNNARFTAKKIIAQTRSTELDIVKSINNSILTLNSLKEQAKLDMSVLELQKSKLLAEEKRVEFGRSNADYLVRYQDDVLNAEVMYLNTLYRLKSAEVNHQLLENSLLSKYIGDSL